MGTYLYRCPLFLILIFLSSCLDEPVKSTIEDYYLSSITSNSSYIFVTASDGRVFRSQDGTNWENLPISNDNILLDIQATELGNVYACGESGIFFTSSNNGETWTKKSTGTSSFLKSLIVYNDSTLFASGNSGIFIGSTDNGSSWFTISVPFSSTISAMALKDEQIYLGVRSGADSNLIYKYDIVKDTLIKLELKAISFISDISNINRKIYFSDFSGVYELIDNGTVISKQAVYINSKNNFINQQTLEYDNQLTLVGYYGFNLGEVIFNPKNNIIIKEFEESIYFNSATVFGDKLILCGGDELEIAVYQHQNWKIIKLN